MKPLDKAVAGLGGVLLVCLVVWVGARLVSRALPALIVLFALLFVYRRMLGRRW